MVYVIVGASIEGVSGLDGIEDRAILAHFLGDVEVGAGFFLSEAGGWISINGVSAKCYDCGRAVGSSSICFSIAIGCCIAKSSRLVCVVPGWLRVTWLLF